MSTRSTQPAGNAVNEQTFLHALAREARHRRATVMYGNVADAFEAARPVAAGAQGPQEATHLSVAVAESLAQAGFPHALLIDPLGRVRFLSEADGAWFALRWQSGAAVDPSTEVVDDAYDLGAIQGGERRAVAPERLDPDALFEGLAARPERFRGLVVVFDWAHLRVGDPVRLAPEDRG